MQYCYALLLKVTFPNTATNIYSYIQLWSELLTPLINIIKEGCENKSTFFILLIIHSKILTKLQPLIAAKQLKAGETFIIK